MWLTIDETAQFIDASYPSKTIESWTANFECDNVHYYVTHLAGEKSAFFYNWIVMTEDNWYSMDVMKWKYTSLSIKSKCYGFDSATVYYILRWLMIHCHVQDMAPQTHRDNCKIYSSLILLLFANIAIMRTAAVFSVSCAVRFGLLDSTGDARARIIWILRVSVIFHGWLDYIVVKCPH